MVKYVRYRGECRGCGKEVATYVLVRVMADDSSPVIIRCNDCRTTTRTDDYEPVSPMA